jgi:hypothetical protein
MFKKRNWTVSYSVPEGRRTVDSLRDTEETEQIMYNTGAVDFCFGSNNKYFYKYNESYRKGFEDMAIRIASKFN